ncbi:hypothetical protein [Actinomadura sp. NTSP31]|uniref:hypothetical protein n=1 Tax=Actinomadura sp. NTSP31 TaxID=1735447 RepID=UPI0035C0B480
MSTPDAAPDVDMDALLLALPDMVKHQVLHMLNQLALLNEDSLVELYAWFRQTRADLADRGVPYTDALYGFGAVVAACSMTIGAPDAPDGGR